MKKLIFIALLYAGSVAQAQQQVPVNINNGWWVVESNVNTPQKQTVKFYNANLQLIYEESYDRKVLNSSKKRIRKMLDSALITALKTQNITTDKATFAKVIKHNY